MGKWYYICVCCFLIAVVVSGAYDDYTKGECRIAALKAGKSVEDIDKICK